MWSALCARAALEPERLAALADARGVAQRCASPAARELISLAEREADLLSRRGPASNLVKMGWLQGVARSVEQSRRTSLAKRPGARLTCSAGGSA